MLMVINLIVGFIEALNEVLDNCNSGLFLNFVAWADEVMS